MIYLRLLGFALSATLVLYYYDVVRNFTKKKIKFKKAIIPFYYWVKNN